MARTALGRSTVPLQGCGWRAPGTPVSGGAGEQGDRTPGATAGDAPAADANEQVTLYALVGGYAWFEALVNRFYDGVATDPALRQRDHPIRGVGAQHGYADEAGGGEEEPGADDSTRTEPGFRERRPTWRPSCSRAALPARPAICLLSA